MTDLLKRWAALEPERCSATPLAAWVRLDGREFPLLHTEPAHGNALLLAAVIEAIEAHDWRWTLKCGTCFYWARVIREVGWDTVEHGCVASEPTDPPAQPLLGAYLEALEAQAPA